MTEIDRIHAKGKQLNEQREALAADACRFFGVDPERDTYERDLCNQIVYHGTQPDIVASMLATFGADSLDKPMGH